MIRLLLVEDNLVDREAIRRAMGRDYAIEECETLREALEYLSGKPELDCLISDLGLPDSTGMDTLQALIDRAPQLPLVVLTGLSDDSVGRRALKLGAQDFIPKSSLSAVVLRRSVRHAIERHRILRALHQTQSQLVQAQRMEAIGQLVGGLAHDFNNVLGVVMMFAHSARGAAPEGAAWASDIDEVIRAGNQAQNLVSQLLASARQRPGEPRLVAVCDVIRAMERLIRRTLSQQIALELSLPEEPAVVHIDPGQLEQVLLNLVVNARDAMPDGGRLTVAVSRPGPVGDREGVLISVSDTGIGMDAPTAARAIEPFFTTKGEAGTGLGLAMCWGIVEQAGGSIGLHSEPGVGTRVEIRLPRREGQPQARPLVQASSTPNGGTEAVLVVEDEVALSRAIERALTRAGYSVQLARDGEEALHLLGGDAGVQLLLTDLSMPRLGGAALARRVAEMRPELPVVVMTGSSGEEHASLGAAAVLTKPFRPSELLACIRRVLDA